MFCYVRLIAFPFSLRFPSRDSHKLPTLDISFVLAIFFMLFFVSLKVLALKELETMKNPIKTVSGRIFRSHFPKRRQTNEVNKNKIPFYLEYLWPRPTHPDACHYQTAVASHFSVMWCIGFCDQIIPFKTEMTNNLNFPLILEFSFHSVRLH